MLRGLKIILLILSLLALFWIFRETKQFFWNDEPYQLAIANIQKEGNYLPYRIRSLLWNRLVIVKTITERVIDFSWFNNFFGIGFISFVWAISKKKWLTFWLFLIGFILIALENNPNFGYYFWFLLPSMSLVWLK